MLLDLCRFSRISAWIGHVALLVTGIGYLSYFFPALKTPIYGRITAIFILWTFIGLASFRAKVAVSTQSFTNSCMLIVVLGIGLTGWFCFNPTMFVEVYNGTGRSDSSAIISAASIALWGFPGVESAVISTFGDLAGNMVSGLSIIACFGSISG